MIAKKPTDMTIRESFSRMRARITTTPPELRQSKDSKPSTKGKQQNVGILQDPFVMNSNMATFDVRLNNQEVTLNLDDRTTLYPKTVYATTLNSNRMMA